MNVHSTEKIHVIVNYVTNCGQVFITKDCFDCGSLLNSQTQEFEKVEIKLEQSTEWSKS